MGSRSMAICCQIGTGIILDIFPSNQYTPINMKTWKSRLQEVYDSFEEFESYAELYNLLPRLGFKSCKEAWKKNPLIGGSVHPEDFGVVKE
jgi:hypothetical protein